MTYEHASTSIQERIIVKTSDPVREIVLPVNNALPDVLAALGVSSTSIDDKSVKIAVPYEINCNKAYSEMNWWSMHNVATSQIKCTQVSGSFQDLYPIARVLHADIYSDGNYQGSVAEQ